MKYIFILFLSLTTISCYAQTTKVEPLSALTNTSAPAWSLIKEWISEAKNSVEVLPKNKERAEKALLESQVPTSSSIGAVIYETGGIVVDHGWIRILGSGSEKIDRSVMEWNKGKSFNQTGQTPSFLLIADDVIGGFFAINNGAFGKEDMGKIFYFASDQLSWQPLGLSYSDFLNFCFNADLNKFYDGLRWTNWKKDVLELNGSKGYIINPPLASKGGRDVNKSSRKIVPMQEIWNSFFTQN